MNTLEPVVGGKLILIGNGLGCLQYRRTRVVVERIEPAPAHRALVLESDDLVAGHGLSPRLQRSLICRNPEERNKNLPVKDERVRILGVLDHRE